MKNKLLIKILKEERRRLYPYGYPILARGQSKTNIRLLRYIAYDVVCNMCADTDRMVSLKEAHDNIDYLVKEWYMAVQGF